MPLDRAALDALRSDARALLPDTAALRHALHRTPETGLELPRTQALVLEALEPLGLEVSTGTGLSSVVAVLRGARPGPAVLLRADMDALPVTEESGEPFASEVPGAMHACGHDLHVAGLVAAARLLAARREEIAGSVVLMFQPGEEGDHGARLMIAEGVLDAAGERVVAAYGLHVLSAILPTGAITSRPGTLLAAADTVHVTVHGRGGHGSMPHLALDPVPVAAEIVLALQAMVTRQFDVFDPVVVTVGRIEAGTTDNVIPADARIEATVRTFSEAVHGLVPERVARVCEGVAAAHGLSVTVDYRRGYPVTSNRPEEADRVARLAGGLFGERSYVTAPQPLAGSEDFAYVLEQVPGAYLGVGATPADLDPRTAPYNHSAHARFEDGALAVGPAVLAALALDRLAEG
ncbi:M20 family metallopeptidase [Cellulomonas sp. ACRRI]|uniref:M20 metallopeptidase family protein n=1 Tax=Cellulomonas sp. ACRRI TaxID=2918188 RepID=UPI001EF18B5E|nr:M20 family metallopeptidase [Cellulomonas sp. ACRRI]MCG7287850.1 M20 family metallopeptidase [Cellulomonas sp. ACRRI]